MGRNQKTLQDLTIKDNFMFAAVMMDPENCRRVLERILEIAIDHVDVSYEKSIVYHPEYKGVRLDVYARDEKNTHFSVEMQVADKKIGKRARYYHSQVDVELLGTGLDYTELPDCYVLFICDFDPIGLGKYRYTMKKTFREKPDLDYEDGEYTIFVSTKGTNEREVPQELVSFLQYVGASLEQSEADYEDDLVKRLQNSVKEIKVNREMGARYMLFEEMMKDEYKAGMEKGMEKGLLIALEKYAPLPEAVTRKISSLTDEDTLTEVLRLAIGSTSLEQFTSEFEKLLEKEKE